MRGRTPSSRSADATALIGQARAEFGQGSAVALLLPLTVALPSDPLVHPEEIARAARFVCQEDADAHLAGRHLARVLLGIKVPVDPFPVSSRGRPELASGGPAFSISHSGPWVAVAVSPKGLIGIDVEARLRGEGADLVKRVCHPNEAAWLSEQLDPRAAFLRIWTRKEAVLKATGTGIATDLTAIDTLPKTEIGADLARDGLRVSSIALSDGALGIAAQDQVTLYQPGSPKRIVP